MTVSYKPELLSNLTNVKTWLSQTGSTAGDAVLSSLLMRISSQVLSYLERSSLLMRTYTDTVDGQNNQNQFLENWPVLSVSSVSVNGNSISAAAYSTTNNNPTSGYFYEDWTGIPPGSPQQVELVGYQFYRGKQNVSITYTAGYGILNESQTVSNASALTNQQYGIWNYDNGVTYTSSGIPLTQVSSNPAQGQYAIDPTTCGNYLFNVADDNAAVSISYSYVPAALEQAILDMINETMQRRNRPGLKSHNLATMESGSFETAYGIPPWAMTILQPYKSVLPL
jgi:hypothetical protein